MTIFVDIFYVRFLNKINFENSIFSDSDKRDNNIFSINKITFFSSSNASSRANSNSTVTIENLYQFTDIALFIDNGSNDNRYNLKNTLKEVYIDNIYFVNTPSLGTPSLYYQTLDGFASGNFSEANLISSSRADFGVSSEDTIDFSSYEVQNNCSKPITLCYINSKIQDSYTIPNNQPITFDGSLLDVCNIPINRLDCSISFDVYITNNLNEKFICPVYFRIPLNSEKNSIQDGHYTIQNSQNFIFYEIL